MKVVAVALLSLGISCHSMLAMAEGPVPFRALMQPAGAEASVPAVTAAQDNSTVPSAKPVHPTHMTSGGRVMAGVGVGLLVCGGFVIGGTAAVGSWASPSRRGALYGGGAGLAATGAILIVVGSHRRSAQ